jgi:hypothetical protein
VLGGGKPVFQELNDRTNLELVESRTLDSRAVLPSYRHAGQGQ